MRLVRDAGDSLKTLVTGFRLFKDAADDFESR